MTMLLTLMFFVTLMGLAFHRTHLLSTLLCLEAMMLIIFITLTLLTKLSLATMVTPLIVLTVSACEAGLGLSLMIATARSQGSDDLKALNLLWC